jgi:uncharacterized protein (TIGR02118 family)
MKLIIMFPPPTDVEKFEADYAEHLQMFHEKMGVPTWAKTYTITKFVPETPVGPSPYYHMFVLPFESAEELNAVLMSPEMQEVAQHAAEISTGGMPVTLLGQ